jgi:hypothetical protein
MIHNDIQNQLALLVKTSVPQLIDVADSPLEAPKWTPGQQLPAQVIANLPSGRFQVQVENQILDMNLPRNTQPGEEIQLTYITSSPRMTFALTPELQAKIPPQVANSGVTLSNTAQFLGALLQKSSPAADASSSLASASGTVYRPVENRVATAELAKTSIVVPGVPPPTKEFAQALHTAVSQSGLFYESHQAQWVTGERTLASILQEPQARFPALNPQPLPAQANAAVSLSTLIQPGTAATGLPAANPNQPVSVVPQAPTPDVATDNLAGVAQAMHVKPGVPTTHGAERDFSVGLQHGIDAQGGLTARDPVHPMAQPIVQQQLDTLETRQIVWQGQVWPGQQMDWTIDEDASHGAQDGENAPRWRTQLHLDMPALGGITAKLMMDGNGVRVDFSADRSKTAERMRSDIASLAQAMLDAGLKVSGLKVNRDGTP